MLWLNYDEVMSAIESAECQVNSSPDFRAGASKAKTFVLEQCNPAETDDSPNRLNQLLQLQRPVWDGDLISKEDRKQLVECGYAQQANGFNFLTVEGVKVLIHLGYLRERR
jgi:hypothetical protein